MLQARHDAPSLNRAEGECGACAGYASVELPRARFNGQDEMLAHETGWVRKAVNRLKQPECIVAELSRTGRSPNFMGFTLPS